MNPREASLIWWMALSDWNLQNVQLRSCCCSGDGSRIIESHRFSPALGRRSHQLSSIASICDDWLRFRWPVFDKVETKAAAIDRRVLVDRFLPFPFLFLFFFASGSPFDNKKNAKRKTAANSRPPRDNHRPINRVSEAPQLSVQSVLFQRNPKIKKIEINEIYTIHVQ